MKKVKTIMKKIRYLLATIAVIALSGCMTQREMMTSEQRCHDTIVVNRVRLDSVYVDRWQQVDRTRDTVYVKDVRRELQYRLVHDTVRIVHTDTLYREQEVVRTQTPTARSWLRRCFDGVCYVVFFSCCLGMLIVLLCVVKYFRS